MVVLNSLRKLLSYCASTALISAVGLAFCIGMILISTALVRHSATHLMGGGGSGAVAEKGERTRHQHVSGAATVPSISHSSRVGGGGNNGGDGATSPPRRQQQEETDALLFNWLVEAPLSQWLADAFLGEEEEEEDEAETGETENVKAAEDDDDGAATAESPSPSSSSSFDNVAGIDFSAMTCAEPIDAVYTWVNGSEPFQRRQLAKWKRAIAGLVTVQQGEGEGGARQLRNDDGDDGDESLSISALADRFARSSALSNGLNRVAQNRTLLRKFVDELLWLRYLRQNASVRLSDDSDSAPIAGAGGADLAPSTAPAAGIATLAPSVRLKKDSTFMHSLVKKFFASSPSAALKTSAAGNPPHESATSMSSSPLRRSSPFRISPEDEALLESMVSNAVSAIHGDRRDDSNDDDSVDHSGGEASASRFADHDELRYSMRSLVTYGGWVRHIYLVTNGQVPTWLNLSHPKITVITHEQLFQHNAKGRELPTFSSNAIEANLHRIPNLSRRFLYFNDDTFFAAPVALEDFYSPTRGHRIYESWLVPSCVQGCPPQWLGDGQCDVTCNVPSCHFDLGDCAAVVASSDGGDNIDEHEAVTVQPADFSTQRDEGHIGDEGKEHQPGSPTLTFNATAFHDEAARYCFVTYVAGGAPAATDAANNQATTTKIDVLKSCLNVQVGDGICDEGCRAAPSCAYDAGDCGNDDNGDGRKAASLEPPITGGDHRGAAQQQREQQLRVASYAVPSSLLLASIVPKSLRHISSPHISSTNNYNNNDRLLAARFYASAATFLSRYGIGSGIGASSDLFFFGDCRNNNSSNGTDSSGAPLGLLTAQLKAELAHLRDALRSAESERRAELQSAIAANSRAQRRSDLLTAAKRDFIIGHKAVRNSTVKWLNMLVSEGVYPSDEKNTATNEKGGEEEEEGEDLIERGFMLEDAEMGLLVKLLREEGTARATAGDEQTKHASDAFSVNKKAQQQQQQQHAPKEPSVSIDDSPSTGDIAALESVYSVLFNFTTDFPRSIITVKAPKSLASDDLKNNSTTIAPAEEIVATKAVRASTVTSVKFAVEGEAISAMNSETRPASTGPAPPLSSSQTTDSQTNQMEGPIKTSPPPPPLSQNHSLDNLVASASFVEAGRALHLLVDQRVLRARRTAALVATLSQLVEMMKRSAAEGSDATNHRPTGDDYFSCAMNNGSLVREDSPSSPNDEGPLLWTGYDVPDPRLVALVGELKEGRTHIHLLRSAALTPTIATLHATLAGDVWSAEQQQFVPQVVNKTARIVDESYSTAPKLCLLLQRMAATLEEYRRISSSESHPHHHSGDKETTSVGSTNRRLLRSLGDQEAPIEAASISVVEFVNVPIRTIKSSSSSASNPLINREGEVAKKGKASAQSQPSNNAVHHQTATASSLRRQLLSAGGPDFFGDSLKHTNMLLTHQYGAQQRRVPAHMVHLIDKEAVEEMWDLWEDEMRRTSASRFRSQTNVQFALAHFYHIAHATVQRSFSDFVREDVKVASDLPQPGAWFSYSDEEFQNRRRRMAADSSSSSSQSSSSSLLFQPTVTTAEEFRRLALLMWDEDLIDPEALKNTANKNKVGVMGAGAVGKTDPPYLDRLQAKERNELLMDYLVKSVETEWTMRSFTPLLAEPTPQSITNLSIDNTTHSSFNASSPSSFVFASRFMTFEEMTTIGPWGGGGGSVRVGGVGAASTIGSFAPPLTEEEELDAALLLRRGSQRPVSAAAEEESSQTPTSLNNNELPWVAVPFGHVPLALSETSESCVVGEHPSDSDDRRPPHPMRRDRVVTPFVDSIYNTELVVVSMINRLLCDIEKSLLLLSLSMDTLLSALWEVEAETYGIVTADETEHINTVAGDDDSGAALPPPRNLVARNAGINQHGESPPFVSAFPSFMNASLIRQTSFLRMYKGIQPDGTILDLSKAGVGPGGFTFGQGSTRDRERDDALPMTDRFFGKMLWLSHVAALRGDHHHDHGPRGEVAAGRDPKTDRRPRHPRQQPCPSMGITDELMRGRLAKSSVDMEALMAGLGLSSSSSSTAPTTGDGGGFGRLVGMAHRVLRKLHQHQRPHTDGLKRSSAGSSDDNAAPLRKSLLLLFYLQHAHFTPTQTISLESDKPLSSYLYTNQVEVPVTLSLIIAGLPRGGHTCEQWDDQHHEQHQSSSPISQSPSSSSSSSSAPISHRRIFRGYRSLLFHELFTLNEAVKSFDRQAQAAKGEALAKARAKLIAESGGLLSDEAALLAALTTQPTTEKPLSLLEIAAMNNHRWRGSRRRNAGDIVRAAQHGSAAEEPTPAPTVAFGDGAPPPYYDAFFEEAMDPRSAAKAICVLEKFLNNTLFDIVDDVDKNNNIDGEGRSPSPPPRPLIRGLLRTSLKMAATMKPTEWPTPPPLSSSQLENSLMGAVVIGMSEENAAAGSTAAEVSDGEGGEEVDVGVNGLSNRRKNEKKRRQKTYLKPRPKGRSQLPTSLLHQQFLRRTTNPFLYDIQKYSSETISVDNPQSSVTFSMIRNNATVVQDQCDHIRHKRPKFLCINDDMDHSEGAAREEHVKVLGVLRDLFEGYFPIASPFERNDGVRNNFTRLTTAELRAIDVANQEKREAHQLRRKRRDRNDEDAMLKHPVVVPTTTQVDHQSKKRESRNSIHANTNLKPPLLRKLFIAMVFIVVGSSAATIVALALLKTAVKKVLSLRKKQE